MRFKFKHSDYGTRMTDKDNHYLNCYLKIQRTYNLKSTLYNIIYSFSDSLPLSTKIVN